MRSKLLLAVVLPSLPAATCRTPALPAPPPVEAVSPGGASGPELARAGSVHASAYQDGSYPYSVAVEEGWVSRPGAADAALRAVFEHVPTGTRLEVWVFHEAPTHPRPRGGCEWIYADTGAYEALRVPGAGDVATCLPDDPAEPLVLGSYLVRDATAYHFELLVPPGRLIQGRRAADSLLSGVRFY